MFVSKMTVLFGLTVALLAAVVPLVSAQDGRDTGAALQALPKCAVACLADRIPHSTCATNPTQECICTNAPLQDQISLCVMANCTVKQTLVAKNMSDTSCNVPMRDRGAEYDTINITLAVMSISVVLVRLGFKLFAVHKLSTDDYVILFLILFALPSVLITHYGIVPNGLGRDIWTLAPENITSFLFYFYIMAIFYFGQVMLVKLCLLLFYLRIFPGPTVRRVLSGTIVFTVLFGIIFFFLAIFQCSPTRHFWESWDGEHEGKCLDMNAIAWANAGISIALDFWMLAIPLAQLRTLNLHWKKKIGVGLMFGVGTFVTIVSIIRLHALVTFLTSHNPTWDNFPVSLWSTVEINVGIVCLCMPTLRLLLIRLFPGMGAGSSYGNPGYYGKSRGDGQVSSNRAQRLGAFGNLTSTSNHNIANVAPSSSVDTVAADMKPAGIIRQQMFAVQFEDDETSLVQMRDLDHTRRRDGEREDGKP